MPIVRVENPVDSDQYVFWMPPGWAPRSRELWLLFQQRPRIMEAAVLRQRTMGRLLSIQYDAFPLTEEDGLRQVLRMAIQTTPVRCECCKALAIGHLSYSFPPDGHGPAVVELDAVDRRADLCADCIRRVTLNPFCERCGHANFADPGRAHCSDECAAEPGDRSD